MRKILIDFNTLVADFTKKLVSKVNTINIFSKKNLPEECKLVKVKYHNPVTVKKKEQHMLYVT